MDRKEYKRKMMESYTKNLADNAFKIIKGLTKKSLDSDVKNIAKQKRTGKPLKVYDPFKKEYFTVDFSQFDKIKQLELRWLHTQLGLLITYGTAGEMTEKTWGEDGDYEVLLNPRLYVRALTELKNEGHPYFLDIDFNEEEFLKKLIEKQKEIKSTRLPTNSSSLTNYEKMERPGSDSNR